MREPLRMALSAFLAPILAASPVFAQAAIPAVTTDGIPCAPAGGNAAITVKATKGASAGGVRLYFHKAGAKDDYFIQLVVGESGDFVGVLPVANGATAVDFHVVATDADGKETALPASSAPVTASCPTTLTTEEQKLAQNIVVGLTVAGQPDQPDGFDCKGIVGLITASGELKQAGCKKKFPLLLVGVGGAAAGAAALVIINNSGGGGQGPISPSRPAPPR